MNDDKVTKDNEITQSLEQITIKPTSRFYQVIETKPWMVTKPDMNTGKSSLTANNRLHTVRIGTAIAILFVCTVLLTPALRLLAQEILTLFVHESKGTVPTEQVMAGLVEYQSWTEEQNQAFANATRAAGFPIAVLAALPDGYQFGQVMYFSNEHLVVSEYLYSTLPFTNAQVAGAPSVTLVQQPLALAFNTPLSFKIGSTADVENVVLNGGQGDYVEGGWTANSSEDPTLTWRWLACCRMLRWQQADYVFTLTTHSLPDTPGFVDRATLIEIANSLKTVKN